MEEARIRLAPHVRRTPLIPIALNLSDRRIFLKLETLHPIGAFKIRPALNAVLSRSPAVIQQGVVTVSSDTWAGQRESPVCPWRHT